MMIYSIEYKPLRIGETELSFILEDVIIYNGYSHSRRLNVM